MYERVDKHVLEGLTALHLRIDCLLLEDDKLVIEGLIKLYKRFDKLLEG